MKLTSWIAAAGILAAVGCGDVTSTAGTQAMLDADAGADGSAAGDATPGTAGAAGGPGTAGTTGTAGSTGTGGDPGPCGGGRVYSCLGVTQCTPQCPPPAAGGTTGAGGAGNTTGLGGA